MGQNGDAMEDSDAGTIAAGEINGMDALGHGVELWLWIQDEFGNLELKYAMTEVGR